MHVVGMVSQFLIGYYHAILVVEIMLFTIPIYHAVQ